MSPFAPGVFAVESGGDEEVFQIKAAQSAGGTVSVNPSSVTEEDAKNGVKVIVTPSKGYGVSFIRINGKEPDSTVNGPVSSGPVSYTHLDVYKRQVYGPDFEKNRDYIR